MGHDVVGQLDGDVWVGANARIKSQYRYASPSALTLRREGLSPITFRQ